MLVEYTEQVLKSELDNWIQLKQSAIAELLKKPPGQAGDISPKPETKDGSAKPQTEEEKAAAAAQAKAEADAKKAAEEKAAAGAAVNEGNEGSGGERR